MDYLEITQRVIDQATAAGADAEAYLTVGKETNIEVNQGEVAKLSFAGSKGLGVRVIQNGRMGYAYTSDFSTDSLRRCTAYALTLAEAADADEFRRLPQPQPVPEEALDNYDPEMATLPAETKVTFAKQLEQAALAADERVIMALNTRYLDNVSDVFLATSKGFSGSYKQSFAAGIVMAMASDGQERAMAFGVGINNSIRKLDAQQIGQEAGEQAAKLLGGKPVPTQEATIVYSPFAAHAVIGALARALTAEAMQKNRSFLQGKMGQDVASDMVTLLDNGRLPGGLATRPFDDEGVPTGATRLIDEGVLQAVLHDTYTAGKERTTSTGNATRLSHRQPPQLTPSNFYLQPGNITPDELIAGVQNGLYVVNTMNTHSINPVSGDYSVSAQGFWIEDGRLTHPVNEVTIAIPLDQLLKNIKAVANDLLFLPFMGAIGSPTFRVDGVMIGGQTIQ
ncbi:MAG: TldD/PmbA family protein [Chloroflexota bacterium]